MKIHVVLAAAALTAVTLATCTTAQAGAVFQVISQGAALGHRSGIGSRAASASWGLSATGGGFVDATIEFNDAFVLPTFGAVATFDENDLLRVRYRHAESAFTPGSPITPVFDVQATNTSGSNQIVHAVGQVVHGGTATAPIYQLNFLNQPGTDPLPAILTSVEIGLFTFLPAGLGGTYLGNFGIDGRAFVLHEALRAGDVLRRDITLIINSTNDGAWQLTGFTASVSAPDFLALTAVGLGGLLTLRRGARSRRALPD